LVTFTSAKSKWIDLLKTFHELKKSHYKDIKDTKFEKEDIFKLVRGNHVICARYYNHIMKCLPKLLSSTNTLFGQVEDIFFVIEFQGRGSEHDHVLLWIKNAPKYRINNYYEIESFVDIYILVTNFYYLKLFVKVNFIIINEPIVKNQPTCRFHFPLLPLRNTQILSPLLNQDKKITIKSTIHFYKIK
jgi:hypothetical protein